tara:strand:+ start:336 stop:761 length:426 start_codon:yes stop_codon:yes gene_type:complete
MADKTTEKEQKIQQTEDDKPDYQEKIMFLVSTTAQGAILAWCLIVLSLGYIKLPNKLGNLEIPDQPRVDSTFAAGLLGNILAGWGVSVGAASSAKKKKKESETANSVGNSSGQQTIIIRQPIELITSKPEVVKVEPTKPKP